VRYVKRISPLHKYAFLIKVEIDLYAFVSVQYNSGRAYFHPHTKFELL